MRIVLDTNVFLSGVFFSGPPNRILRAWRDGQVKLLVSAEIFDEYRHVGVKLAKRYAGVDLEPFLALLAVESEIVSAAALSELVCEDPDDDKFFACALSGRCKLIVSGDRHLKRASGYGGVVVLSPRQFVDDRL